MKRIIILLTANLLFCYFVNSQEAIDNLNKLLSKTTSPEASALLSYAEFPVDYYTGRSNINIPLYEIEVDDFSLPISLSYCTGGIKVTDEASWVGLGWSLNAGGLVHHNIIDGDLNYCDTPLSLNAHGSFFTPRRNRELNESDISYAYSGDNHYDKTVDGYYDSEPDWLTYNFGNYSGKFFDYHQNTNSDYIELVKKGLKLYNGDPFNLITGKDISEHFDWWTIVDLSGNIYVFADLEKVETVQNHGSMATGVSYSFTSYLTLIKTNTGKLIHFNYNTSQQVSHLIPNFDATVEFKKTNNTCYPSPSCEGDKLNYINNLNYQLTSEYAGGSNAFTHPKTSSTSTITTQLYLSSITWPGGSIEFSATARTDFEGKKLDYVIIKDNQDQVVKTFQLINSYFEGNAFYGDYWENAPETWFNVNRRSQRLRLDEIRAVDKYNNSLLLNKFTYYQDHLPYKTSLAQDYWGYFNGANNTSLFSKKNRFYNKFIPQYIIEYYIPDQNREPSEDFAKAFSLKEVKYATGGTTNFAYGLNEYEKTRFDDIFNVDESTLGWADGENGGNTTLTFTVNNTTGKDKYKLFMELRCPGECIPYGNNDHPEDNVCYVQIRGISPGSTFNRIYDYSSTVPTFIYNPYLDTYSWQGYIDLDDGNYEIHVNNPFISGGKANASIIEYKYSNPPDIIIPGAGIRVEQKIVSDGSKTRTDNFQYEGGKLLCPQRFARKYFTGSSQNVFIGDGFCQGVTITTDTIITISCSSFIPDYMSRSIIGYDHVTVTSNDQNDMGSTTYTYVNTPGYIYTDFYESMLPGVPLFRSYR